MTRALRHAGGLLTVLGVLGLLDALLTVTWQEPVTALIGKTAQARLLADLRGLEGAAPTQLELSALARLRTEPERIAYLAGSLERRSGTGHAVGRLRIARMGVNLVLVKGSDASALERGPGFYDGTPFPGMQGTTAIAGHRTWFLAPFRHIDRLRAGDAIHIEMPYARFDYRVERHAIVSPGDLSVLRRAPYDRLVLSACHPVYSAKQRWVVFARLARVIPVRLAATVQHVSNITQLPPLVRR